jgi:hypothetical protein
MSATSSFFCKNVMFGKILFSKGNDFFTGALAEVDMVKVTINNDFRSVGKD